MLSTFGDRNVRNEVFCVSNLKDKQNRAFLTKQLHAEISLISF